MPLKHCFLLHLYIWFLIVNLSIFWWNFRQIYKSFVYFQGHFIEVQVTDGALYRTKIHCYFLDQVGTFLLLSLFIYLILRWLVMKLSFFRDISKIRLIVTSEKQNILEGENTHCFDHIHCTKNIFFFYILFCLSIETAEWLIYDSLKIHNFLIKSMM